MVTNHPKDSHPPSRVWSRSHTIPRTVTHHPIPNIQGMVNHHPKDAHHYPKDAHPPSPGFSTTIPKMATNYPVIHQPRNGHPPSQGWSSTIPGVVTHPQSDGHPLSSGRLHSISRNITFYPHDGGCSPFPG